MNRYYASDGQSGIVARLNGSSTGSGCSSGCGSGSGCGSCGTGCGNGCGCSGDCGCSTLPTVPPCPGPFPPVIGPTGPTGAGIYTQRFRMAITSANRPKFYTAAIVNKFPLWYNALCDGMRNEKEFDSL